MKRLKGLKKLLRSVAEPFKRHDDPILVAGAKHLERRLSRLEGLFDWNVDKGEVLWTAEMFRLLGLKRNEPLTLDEAWQRNAVPEDIPAAAAALEQSLATGCPLLMAARHRTKRGCRWTILLGEVVTRNGKARRICGIAFELKKGSFPCLKHDHAVKVSKRPKASRKP